MPHKSSVVYNQLEALVTQNSLLTHSSD